MTRDAPNMWVPWTL